MARINQHSLLKGLKGQIGKQLVFKQYGKKTVVSRYPDMSNVKPSVLQLENQTRFGKAVAYAKAINNDPVLKAAQAPGASGGGVDASEADLPQLLDLLHRQDLDALTWWRERTHWLQARFGVTLVERVSHLLDDLDFAGASAALTEEQQP